MVLRKCGRSAIEYNQYGLLMRNSAFNKEQIKEKLDLVFKRVDDDVPKYDPHKWDNVEAIVIASGDNNDESVV